MGVTRAAKASSVRLGERPRFVVQQPGPELQRNGARILVARLRQKLQKVAGQRVLMASVRWRHLYPLAMRVPFGRRAELGGSPVTDAIFARASPVPAAFARSSRRAVGNQRVARSVHSAFTLTSSKSRVAALKVSPKTVLDDIQRLCELADMRAALDVRAATILKDNISWHYPFPGANTTPWQLEGSILALRRAGFGELSCVQNETVVTNPFKGEELNHYRPVLQRHRVPVLYNFRPSDMTWVDYRPRCKLHVLNQVFPEGLRIPDYFLGKNVVHLPTMKCHIYTTTTGAMKNAFGGLLSRKRHYTHSWIHRTLVDLLAIQREIHAGLFAIMDGTTAGNGPGPRTLIPVVKGYMLASSDQVAIDAVAAKMMGFDPLSIEYIRVAHEDGLGVGDPREIELVGDDVSGQNWHFAVGDNAASRVGDLLWFGRLRHWQQLFFHTPLARVFALGSTLYHDAYRWRCRDARVFEEWQRSTEWGQLFARYATLEAGNTAMD